MTLKVNTTLGNFRIIRHLGQGGMSDVYLVQDNLQRYFALKTLAPSLAADPSFKERFKNEAMIMASLNHPNIVQLHSYFEEADQYCLVMEYIDGGSLKELIQQIGPLPEPKALGYLRQTALALQYAHSKGILHRDIKPSNILIDSQGHLKVMDFGIARMMGSVGMTKTGSRIGTLIYMSPEQIKDSKHLTGASDVYSLGASFYEMLSGNTPYSEETESEFTISEKIVYNELPDPRDSYPHIEIDSIELLRQMTRKEPEERIKIAEVVEWLSADSSETLPPPVINSYRMPASENSAPKPEPTPPVAASSSNKSPMIWYIGIPLIILALGFMIFIFTRGGQRQEQITGQNNGNKSNPNQVYSDAAQMDGTYANQEYYSDSEFTHNDQADISAVLNLWNTAHNQNFAENFRQVFADRVDFYHENLSREAVVSLKYKLLTVTYPGFYQEVSLPTLKRLGENEVLVEFVKTAHYNGKVTDYQAYLHMRKEGYSWRIINESDKTTDRNLK